MVFAGMYSYLQSGSSTDPSFLDQSAQRAFEIGMIEPNLTWVAVLPGLPLPTFSLQLHRVVEDTARGYEASSFIPMHRHRPVEYSRRLFQFPYQLRIQRRTYGHRDSSWSYNSHLTHALYGLHLPSVQLLQHPLVTAADPLPVLCYAVVFLICVPCYLVSQAV